MNEKLNGEELDNVMRRIRKMLAIAEDSRANEGEAANAARMAEVLMRKYQIDHIDTVRRDMEDVAAFTTVDVRAQMNRNYDKSKTVPLWAQWIAVQVARLHDCQVVLNRNGETGAFIRIRGYKTDAEIAGWTFDYLVSVVIQMCKTFRNGPTYYGPRSINAYRNGLALGLSDRIRGLIEAKKFEMQAHSNSRALVVVKADALAKHFGVVRYKKQTKTQVRDANAFAQGRFDSKKVNLTQRVIKEK